MPVAFPIVVICTGQHCQRMIWRFCLVSGRVCINAIWGEGQDEGGAFTRDRFDKAQPWLEGRRQVEESSFEIRKTIFFDLPRVGYTLSVSLTQPTKDSQSWICLLFKKACWLTATDMPQELVYQGLEDGWDSSRRDGIIQREWEFHWKYSQVESISVAEKMEAHSFCERADCSLWQVACVNNQIMWC